MNQNSEIPKDTFVLLSLGANLGNPPESITKAVELMLSSGIIRKAEMSSLYETEPVGFTDQPWFTNAVVAGYTDMPLFNLIEACKSVEYCMERRERPRWHEREIDIDILLYGDSTCENQQITVPHPRMHERRFVLEPAAEIAGEVLHPSFNRTLEDLLSDCHDNSVVIHKPIDKSNIAQQNNNCSTNPIIKK